MFQMHVYLPTLEIAPVLILCCKAATLRLEEENFKLQDARQL